MCVCVCAAASGALRAKCVCVCGPGLITNVWRQSKPALYLSVRDGGRKEKKRTTVLTFDVF